MMQEKMSQAWLGDKGSQKFIFLTTVELWSKNFKSGISGILNKQTINNLAVLKKEHYIFHKEYLQWTELRQFRTIN